MSRQMLFHHHTVKVDMLHGPLLRRILLFALPLAASSILQQLFNSADLAVAGRFAGHLAQAAVGVNTSVINLLINLFVGLSVGANVVIANYIGQRRREEVLDAVHTVMTLSLLCGVFLMGLGQIAARPILTAMDTPSDTLDLAVTYLRIYFLGMPFVMVYNFGAAVLRSVGDTRRPLYSLLVSGVINVLLNLLFVIGFHRSADGVAIATVISNGVSAALIVLFLLREEEMIRLDPRRLRIKKSLLVRVARIGVPAGIQSTVFSLSNVCIQSAINSFGSAAIAGSSAAVNFEFFTYFVTSAFSQAAVTFISQNYGARQFDRCRKIIWLSMGAGLVITGLMCAAFVLGRGVVIRFYTTDPDVVYYGLIRMLRVEMYAFLAVTYEVMGASLRGLGYSITPTVLMLIGSCALRLVWVFTLFQRFSTYEMLMDVYPVSWVITGVLLFAAYAVIRRKVFAKTAVSA